MLSAELDMRNIADHSLIFDCDGVLQHRRYSIEELFEQANLQHSQSLQSDFRQLEAEYLTKPGLESAIRSWTGERRISEMQISQLLAGYISVTIFSDITESASIRGTAPPGVARCEVQGPSRTVPDGDIRVIDAFTLGNNTLTLRLCIEPCDAACGFLHSDRPGRDSLVYDVMEPYRPRVDAALLEFLAKTTFRKGASFS
jgi:hypothetical protein